MATKKSDYMSLTKYLEAADVQGVSAVGLARAISAAIAEGTLTQMYPSTSKAEKYTIDENGKIKRGMPETGYQVYRDDYIIFNEDEFDTWYRETYLVSIQNKGSKTAKKEVTLDDLMAMTPEQREKHYREVNEAKSKTKNTNNSVSKKKEAQVREFIKKGDFSGADKFLDEWNVKGAESAATKSGLREEIAKARRNAEEEE